MTPILAILLTAQAQPPAIYRCDGDFYGVDLPGSSDGVGLLHLNKSFAADGAPIDLAVSVTADNGIAIAPAGRSTIVGLDWSDAGEAGPRPAQFDWSRGRIVVSYSSGDSAAALRTGEAWRRVIVERDDQVLNNSRAGAAAEGDDAFVLPTDHHLASELLAPDLRPQLRMSAEALLAWGSGRQRLIVYETAITPSGRDGREGYSPFGRERITGRYEIDVPALARLVARVRQMTEEWEATLTDPRRQCRRH